MKFVMYQFSLDFEFHTCVHVATWDDNDWLLTKNECVEGASAPPCFLDMFYINDRLTIFALNYIYMQ